MYCIKTTLLTGKTTNRKTASQWKLNWELNLEIFDDNVNHLRYVYKTHYIYKNGIDTTPQLFYWLGVQSTLKLHSTYSHRKANSDTIIVATHV